MSKISATLQELLTPTIEALGYELWGCVVISQGRHTLLRVYIDKEQGITVADCELVSRQISAVLDVEDPISSAYALEVSSPGLDRPLFNKEQFERFIGATVDIRMHLPITNRRHFKGKLQSVNEDGVIILLDDKEFVLAFDNIAKANVVPEEILGRK